MMQAMKSDRQKVLAHEVFSRIQEARVAGYRLGYDHGFVAGEAAAKLDRAPAIDRALGIGVVMGTGIGVIVTAVLLLWWLP